MRTAVASVTTVVALGFTGALGAAAASALDAGSDPGPDASAARTPTVHPREGYCGRAGTQRAEFSDPAHLTVGPLAILGAAAVADAPLERVRNGQKLPVLVRYRHRVTVSVARDSRDEARLAYGRRAFDRNGNGRPLSQLPARMRFLACERVDRSDRGAPLRDGEVNANFWPGAIRLKEGPACVHLKITVDNRAPVRRSLGFAMRCPTGTE
jgi:hypothetical protein